MYALIIAGRSKCRVKLFLFLMACLTSVRMLSTSSLPQDFAAIASRLERSLRCRPEKNQRRNATSKIARGGEIVQERRSHGHNSVDHSNPSVNWGVTSLAVQFRVGILAKRRIRPDSFDRNYPRADGTHLNCCALIEPERISAPDQSADRLLVQRADNGQFLGRISLGRRNEC
jgi:hypothetical protein